MHLLFATVYARLSGDRRQTGAFTGISGMPETLKVRKVAGRGKFSLTARARAPIMERLTGCSAAGSALGSGPRGRGFKSPHSDHKIEMPATVVVAGFSCIHAGFQAFGKRYLLPKRSKKRHSYSKIISNFRYEFRYEKPAPLSELVFFISVPRTTTRLRAARQPSAPPRGSLRCQHGFPSRPRPARCMSCPR